MSKQNRVALLPSELLDQLQSDKDLLARDYSAELDMKNGVISRLFGFDIMERSSVLRYNNNATPGVKDPDAAGAATDNEGILCWQKDAVERALGAIEMFEKLGDPQFYGDIYSFLVMFGGRIRRADGKGIVAIIQDAAA